MMEVDVVMVANLDTDELKFMTENALTSLKESEKEIYFNVEMEIDDGTREFNYNSFLCTGISKGTSEWVVLANNDLIFSSGWFSEILKVYESDNTIKSFGVWEPTLSPRYFDEKRERYFGYRISMEATGWCIVIRREVLEQIDFCNETNQRASFWFSDNILMDLLMKYKIKHCLVRDAKVTHLLNQTLNLQSQERRRELTTNQRIIYGTRSI